MFGALGMCESTKHSCGFAPQTIGAVWGAVDRSGGLTKQEPGEPVKSRLVPTSKPLWAGWCGLEP